MDQCNRDCTILANKKQQFAELQSFWIAALSLYWNCCRMTRWGGSMSGKNGYQLLLGFPPTQAQCLLINQVMIRWQLLCRRSQWRKWIQTKVVWQVKQTLTLRLLQEVVYQSLLASHNSPMGRILKTPTQAGTDQYMSLKKIQEKSCQSSALLFLEGFGRKWGVRVLMKLWDLFFCYSVTWTGFGSILMRLVEEYRIRFIYKLLSKDKEWEESETEST